MALNSKLEELNNIKDDSIFARKLKALAGVPDSIVEKESPPDPPQVINVNVATPTAAKTFKLTRADGTIVEGEISNAVNVETK